MAIRVKPPMPIKVLSYDKVFFDNLSPSDYMFAVQNAEVIDGVAYLTSWLNTADESYRKVFW